MPILLKKVRRFTKCLYIIIVINTRFRRSDDALNMIEVDCVIFVIVPEYFLFYRLFTFVTYMKYNLLLIPSSFKQLNI